MSYEKEKVRGNADYGDAFERAYAIRRIAAFLEALREIPCTVSLKVIIRAVGRKCGFYAPAVVLLDGTINVVTKDARRVVNRFVHELDSCAGEFAHRYPNISVEIIYKQEFNIDAAKTGRGGRKRR